MLWRSSVESRAVAALGTMIAPATQPFWHWLSAKRDRRIHFLEAR
jgi:hypothetical protein